MSTVMWEVVAADGQLDALLAWALDHAPADADVYRSDDDRVVVIDPTGMGMPTAPSGLVSRPAHSWTFVPVRR